MALYIISPLPPLKLQNSWKSVNKGLGIGTLTHHLWKCRIPGSRVNHIDSVRPPPTLGTAEFLEITNFGFLHPRPLEEQNSWKKINLEIEKTISTLKYTYSIWENQIIAQIQNWVNCVPYPPLKNTLDYPPTPERIFCPIRY